MYVLLNYRLTQVPVRMWAQGSRKGFRHITSEHGINTTLIEKLRMWTMKQRRAPLQLVCLQRGYPQSYLKLVSICVPPPPHMIDICNFWYTVIAVLSFSCREKHVKHWEREGSFKGKEQRKWGMNDAILWLLSLNMPVCVYTCRHIEPGTTRRHWSTIPEVSSSVPRQLHTIIEQ